jgi:putative ABC transport system permease protein
MNWFKQIWMRRRMCRDLSEEIRQHLDENIEALMADGMSRGEAEQSARRQFGNVTAIEERGREAWMYPFIEGLWADLKYAIRQLRKNPGYASTTILILALGIGATTGVFSLVNAVLLRPLPFPQPNRLMWISQQDHSLPGMAAESLSYPDYFDWRAQNRTFSGLASYVGGGAILQTRGESRRLDSQTVSSQFFDVLGVAPILGRNFDQNDEKPGNRAVMLSYSFWQSEFASARNVAGSSVQMDGHAYTVAGVMPDGFQFPLGNPAPTLWKSLAEEAEGKNPKTEQRGFDVLGVIGRLKPGVTEDRARADLSLIARNLARQYPDNNKQYYSALVKPELEHLTGDVRPAMRLLFGAVTLVLLLVCANVAGLLLARGSSRTSEFAVRTAIGAGRAAIVRQVLVESITLFLCGGVLGLALASSLVHATLKLMPVEIPRIQTATLDARVLVFVLIVSSLTGLIFGAFPAWRMSRAALQQSLRDGSRSLSGGKGQHRLHSGLVIAQTAIGMVLLVGSGLMMRSFMHILRVDPGFDPKHVLTSRVGVSFDSLNHDQHFLFYQQLLTRISALPGVQTASAGWPMPMSDNSASISFNIAGRPVAKGDEPSASLGIAMPGYFATMHIPVIAGRTFGEQDGLKGPPTIIVNQAFARKYFAGQNPIGQHIQVGLGDDVFEHPVREVVGVIGDIKCKGLAAEADPQYYLPYAQAIITNPYVVVRSNVEPVAMQRAISSAIHEFDKTVPVYNVSPLEQYIFDSAAQPRFQAFLLTCFAAIGLILTAIGLYGLLSYTVVRRTFEIGLRMALGAQRSDVLAMIVRHGLILALVGTGAGLALSVFVTRFISGLLFHIQPLDPLTFAATSALLLMVSVAASGVPAYRAAFLDPIQTLREH